MDRETPLACIHGEDAELAVVEVADDVATIRLDDGPVVFDLAELRAALEVGERAA
jgi:hypothetical protein